MKSQDSLISFIQQSKLTSKYEYQKAQRLTKKITIIDYDTNNAIIEFFSGKTNVCKAWNGMEENLDNLDQKS